jgi:hypothetical protein
MDVTDRQVEPKSGVLSTGIVVIKDSLAFAAFWAARISA